jgi:hypothetical protein
MCLVVIAFDWALILISSLLGTTLIVNAFPEIGQIRIFLFIGCMVTGLVMQYMTLKGAVNQGGRTTRSPIRRQRQYVGSSQGGP